MWDAVVSPWNATVGRILAGPLSLSSGHPILMFSVLALMTMLVWTVWVDVIEARLKASRWRAKAGHEHPIRMRRR